MPKSKENAERRERRVGNTFSTTYTFFRKNAHNLSLFCIFATEIVPGTRKKSSRKLITITRRPVLESGYKAPGATEEVLE